MNANINNLKTGNQASMFTKKEDADKNRSLLGNTKEMLESDAVREKSNGIQWEGLILTVKQNIKYFLHGYLKKFLENPNRL